MASVLCRRARQLRRSSGLRAVVQRVSAARGCSAAGSDEPFIAVPAQHSGPRTVWPDEAMGPFGPQDQRFQLPGNVGFDCHLKGTGFEWKGAVHRSVPDVLSAPCSSERHEFILAQFVNEYQGKEVSVAAQPVSKAEQYFSQSEVECSMRSCPELLKKELEVCFPTLPAGPLTVVTVTQKYRRTDTEATEKEEEEVLEKLVSGAQDLCFTLWRGGYWADFIHPSSGKAFFAHHTQDNAHHPAGFHIEDLASCTLIRHVLRGRPTLILTLVTNAPSNSLIVEKLQGRAKASQEVD